MRLTVPVVPDADTAREWAREELTGRQYQGQGETWLDAFSRWLADLFADITGAGSNLSTGALVILVVIAVAVVAVVTFVVLGPMRRSTAGGGAAGGMLAGDERSSDDMRAAAARARLNEDWTTALVEIYRATVKGAAERRLIQVGPGMTADEAARALTSHAPAQAEPLRQVSTAFDRARYGGTVLTEPDWQVAAQLDEALRTSRAHAGGAR